MLARFPSVVGRCPDNPLPLRSMPATRPDLVSANAVPTVQILIFEPAIGPSPPRAVRNPKEILQRFRIDLVAEREIHRGSAGLKRPKPCFELVGARHARSRLLAPATE